MLDTVGWRVAVTDAVEDYAPEALEALESVPFIEALDHTLDLDGEDLVLAVAEAVDDWQEAADKPYGDVAYADPGYQDDDKARYPLDSEEHCRAAWSYINQAENAGKYTAEQLGLIKARIRRALKRYGVQTTEALDRIVEMYDDSQAHPHAPAGSPAGGQFTSTGGNSGGKKPATGRGRPAAKPAPKPTGDLAWNGKVGAGYGMKGGDERVHALQQALNRLGIKDAQGQPLKDDGLYGPRTTSAVRSLQRRLGMQPTGVVTPDFLKQVTALQSLPKRKREGFVGEDGTELVDLPAGAEVRALEGVEEAEDTIEGRVIEARGTDDAGGRVFRVRVIRVGDSKNGRRYREGVLRNAAPLYEGAKAYDHHRTADELRTSTINGLVGSYRAVGFEGDGIYADLHLLPSATHTAEALDASLAAQAQGLPPLVGISHDVLASYATVQAGGRRMQEATAITKVNSADVVADPAAGGIATRMVAGGVEPDTEESDVTVTTEAVLDALKTAGDEQLAAVGLARVTPSTESTEERSTEAGELKGSMLASLLIREKLADADMSAMRESIVARLPERVTEADIDREIAAYKGMLADVERAGLRPSATVAVTQEAHQKKVAALDAFFAQDFRNGYRSFKEAFCDITGRNPRGFTEDFNRIIMQESAGPLGQMYDSDGRIVNGERTTESMTSSSWNLVLGDSITRRLVAEYDQPSLQSYKSIVSSTVPVSDFRTQRIDRIGGYGTLPAVNQGAPYQPLTSPTNEEVTYAITKRGGTEDITLEMIANDDVRAISRIPKKLGLAAAQTLFRFVWDFLDTNATIYDSVALFNASHGSNTATSNALSQTNLSAGRLVMRGQTAYGDTADNLSIIPKTLIIVNDLEEIGFQLTTSAVAIPATPAGPSNTPNLHKGLDLVIVDYWTSTTKWYLVADPAMVPTFELGFYQGREQPELFTQSDPTVGSMFNADTLTMKIRHIYSGAVLDWRGFYRGYAT